MLRGFLTAVFALGLGVPAFAQSPGYSAVFGGGSPAAGPGYSSVFGDSDDARGSNYVSPLFEQTDEPQRRFSFWARSRYAASSSLSAGDGTEDKSDQNFQFLDSLNGSHSAGSADFMSGIGVVSGSGNSAAYVDTLHRGMGYAARGANAYLNSLGGRGSISESFFDADGKMGMKKPASPLATDPSGVAGLNARLQNMLPYGDTINSSTVQNEAAYSQQNANRDVYGPPGAINSAPSGYDMVFGAGGVSRTPPTTDYVDPLSSVSGYSPPAGLNAGRPPAYGAYQTGAVAGSGYRSPGSVGQRMPGAAPGQSWSGAGAVDARQSGAGAVDARQSGGNLIDRYGTASLKDPLAGYLLK